MLTFRSSLDAVGLHGHMCIQMIQCAIGLLAAIPATLVHSLNFLISTTRPLVLLSARDRNKRVHLQNSHISYWSSDNLDFFKDENKKGRVVN